MPAQTTAASALHVSASSKHCGGTSAGAATNPSCGRGCQTSRGSGSCCGLHFPAGDSCLRSLSGERGLQKESPQAAGPPPDPLLQPSTGLCLKNHGALLRLGRALDKTRQLYLHRTEKPRPVDGAHQRDSRLAAPVGITAAPAGASKHSVSGRERLCQRFRSSRIPYPGADTHTQRFPQQQFS